MRKDRPEDLKNQPALIVTYGNTTNKHRPLDSEVVTLGRSRSCDFTLMSPEVAPIHCFLARVASGWRLRDCTGRGWTRLNGKPVTDELLTDGDILQVGTFSFEVQLPPGERPRPVDDAYVRRLGRSRRNLARLALSLRKQLRVVQSSLRSQEEVDQQADRLRSIQRDWEHRRKQMEQADAAARAEREALEKSLTERVRQVEELEAALAQRQEEAQARLQEGRRELDEARRQVEESIEQRVAGLQAAAVDVAPPSKALNELERSSRKLARFARRLRRSHQQLQEQARELAREHLRLIGTDKNGEDVQSRIEALEAQVAQQQAQLEAKDKEMAALQALEDAQSAFLEVSGGAQMQAMIANLRQQIKQRDELLDRLNQRLAFYTSSPNAEDMASYEEELNRYRVEIERDRREMNEQMALLQERHQEMEEALREAELQMSRERAQIAREQTELNRLRNELAHLQTLHQRPEGAKDRETVARLKEELAHKRQAEEVNGGNGRGNRLRNLLGLLRGPNP